jgi:hypothetical protein
MEAKALPKFVSPSRIAEGIAFMQGLVSFAEHGGERTAYDLDLMRMTMGTTAE